MPQKSKTRLLSEMQSVVLDKEFAKKNPKIELYHVYRKVAKKKDLRYDITEMPARMLGKEFVRTKGNSNSEKYQELYTVLEGNAIFLIQKQQKRIVQDVAAINAQKGEWVIIPPDYSVITINPSKTDILKIGNWVSEKTQNIYKELEDAGGASYFYTQSGWIKNKNYQRIPILRFGKPLKTKPSSLDFLSRGGGTGRRVAFRTL